MGREQDWEDYCQCILRINIKNLKSIRIYLCIYTSVCNYKILTESVGHSCSGQRSY